ncbi:MAG: GNAT family N-acetyltransferase [Rhodospirillales bacterium]|nr:GNAT family N-acetyltransferase [Rhodospirillales bacterium]
MSAPAEEAVPAGKLRSVVTHLAMTPPPPHAPPARPPGVAIWRRWTISTDEYLLLYAEIGEGWLWWSRLTWDVDLLQDYLVEEETEIYVAEADGEEIGLIELDVRPAPDIELRYFGVVPSRIGTGLGSWLLRYAIAAGSRHRPRRMILNTCTYDHPGALAFYRRHGFAVTHSEVEFVDDPRLTGLLPLDAAPHVPLARPADG